MDPSVGHHPAPPAGLIAGRYEVGEVLGLGGMGEVRAGRDQRLGRDVAIKFLRPEMAEHPAIRQRFQEEARSAASLVHPHLVAVFDTGEEAGVPYLVMERLSGRTLVDEIVRGPLDCEAVRTLGLQMLDALGAAHAAGLVHRDVKPGNVMAAGDGWKLGDFGVAKSIEASDHNLTVTGLVVGTPAYLAPERLAGAPASVATDLYAVGVVLYEALTGRRPFDANAPIDAPFTMTPPPVNGLRPDIPASLAAAVTRAIQADPSRRFGSAAHMAQALAAPEPATQAPQTVVLAPASEPVTPTLVDLPLLAPPDPAPPDPAPLGPAAAGAAPGAAAGRPGGRAPRPLPLADHPHRSAILAAIGLTVAVVLVLIIASARQGRTPALSGTAQGSPTPAVQASLPPSLESSFQRLEQLVRP